MNYNDTLNNLIQAIEKVVDVKLKTNTKIVKGIVVSYMDNTYIIKIDGTDYKIKDSNNYSIGKSVYICRPNGNAKEQFIINSNTNASVGETNVEFINWDVI